MNPTTQKKTEHRTKICFFALNVYPVFTENFQNHNGVMGGSELQQSIIGKELVKNNLDVSYIIYGNDIPSPEFIEGVTFFKTINKNFRLSGFFSFLTCLNSLWNSMKSADADIYYQRGAGAETGIVALFCFFRRKKFIFGLSSDVDADGTFIKNANFFEKSLFYYGLKKANAIIAQSDYQKQLIKAKFNRESKVIKNVCRIRIVFPKIKKHKVVLWVGTIRPEWKQPELFLALARSIPHAKFHMVGGASSDSIFYQNFIREANNVSNLKLFGFIPYSKIDNIFAESDVFVNTSSHEGFPNTFLQAWEQEIPVVSLNIDPDGIIIHRKLGFHSRTFETMVSDVNELLNNEDLRINLGKNGRKYLMEEHDVNVIIRQYIDLIQTLT